MFLKNYQIKVVTAFKQFYQAAGEAKASFDTARKALPENLRAALNWVEPVFKTIGKEYRDKCSNGLGEYYPRIVLKVPTYGGKLELVCIFESKGEHLLGNVDTQYKKKVLDLMTQQHRGKRIERYRQRELPFTEINENAEFYLLEENKEEETVRNLFR